MGISFAVMHQPFSQYRISRIVEDIVSHLGLLLRLERKILAIIASYAVAIGMFLLCVPIAVQELVGGSRAATGWRSTPVNRSTR